jgi:glycosyltransferase involved in cell wall biosynthesis
MTSPQGGIPEPTPQSPPLVSVVVPSYNHARYVQAAVQSVLDQSYAHVELIVIDDGSTDDSLEVLERLGGGFHLESQPNAGQAATLNRGWTIARGEILSYLSADDLLMPHAIANAVEYLRRSPATVMVYGDFDLIDERSRVLRRVRAPDFDYFDMVVRTACPPGPGVFFRRGAHEAAGGWNPAFRQWPDYDYWLRLGLQGSFQRIPQALAAFRVHDQSQTLSRVSFERAEEPTRVVRGYFESHANIPAHIGRAKKTALSHAEVASAQLHFRAGRIGAAAVHLWNAAKLDPGVFASPRALYVCVHGLVGRPLMMSWLKLRGWAAKVR